jgi:hypothetical protein
VIGAGPYRNVLRLSPEKSGYEVTVFEANEKTGGMLRTAFRNTACLKLFWTKSSSALLIWGWNPLQYQAGQRYQPGPDKKRV